MDDKYEKPGKPMFSRRILFIWVLLVLCVLIAALTVPAHRRFVVMEQRTGKILYSADLEPGDTFKVTYIHSVNKSPVEDIFEIQADYSIMVKKTVFRSFGAGIPFEPDRGQSFKVYDDRMEIDNINLKLKEYLLFVGLTAKHTLWIKGREIRLDQLTEPQQSVKIEVRKIPFYTMIRRAQNVAQ